jgi:signal transduction histidine kinase
VLLPGTEIPLNSYPGAIAQIITNLITNSIHHAFHHTTEKQIRIELTQTSQQTRIRYSDNGCGIAEDIRPKIFEPFFTTARLTGGSGLGLSIVYNLVTQKLGGDIVLDDDQSQGAGFEIRIHKRLIDILDPGADLVSQLSRVDLPAGVEIEVRL